MNGRSVVGTVVIAALLFVVLIHGCGGESKRDVEHIIRERAEERIAAHVANSTEECRDQILAIATRKADSLLIDRARRLRRLDGRPPKPRRPGAPPVRELSAPLPLRPLFPFEIRFDTLLRDSLYQDSLRLDSLQRVDLQFTN